MYNITSKVIILILGIIFILAGIFKWKIPTIYWFLRESKYGEIFNNFVMLCIGIICIIIFFSNIKSF